MVSWFYIRSLWTGALSALPDYDFGSATPRVTLAVIEQRHTGGSKVVFHQEKCVSKVFHGEYDKQRQSAL
jgi:hypothetical protein